MGGFGARSGSYRPDWTVLSVVAWWSHDTRQYPGLASIRWTLHLLRAAETAVGSARWTLGSHLGVKGSQVQILSSRRVAGRYPNCRGAALTCVYARE